MSGRGSVAYLLHKTVYLYQNVETWKHGMNGITIRGVVSGGIWSWGLRREGGVGKNGRFDGKNGALRVRNERTKLVVAIEKRGEKLLVVEGVESNTPAVHFDRDSVGIIQSQIAHVNDEPFPRFLDIRSGNRVDSVARHEACA